MSNEDIIAEFLKRFRDIKAQGFIEAHRTNNTGIGKTFEDLIGVAENNIQDVDFLGLIELKAKRINSDSMLTIFTKAPDFPENCNEKLLEQFGYIGADGKKRLHTTISGNKSNTFKNKYGFKFECDDNKQRMTIVVTDLKDGKILSDSAYYSYDTLKNIVEKKCKIIAFVEAETRKNSDGKEEFHYVKGRLLTDFTFDKLLLGIRNGWIKYDIRIGLNPDGSKHDHGSGFRVMRRNIGDLFAVDDFS